MALREAKSDHRQWRTYLHVSENPHCLLSCLLIQCKSIDDKFTIRGSRCKETIIAVESYSSDWISLVMVSDKRLKLLGPHIYDTNRSIITSESYVNWLGWETEVCDRDTPRTQLHFLDHVSIGGSGKGSWTGIGPASCDDHIIVRPGEGWYFESTMWVIYQCTWYTVIQPVDQNLGCCTCEKVSLWPFNRSWDLYSCWARWLMGGVLITCALVFVRGCFTKTAKIGSRFFHFKSLFINDLN